MKILILAPYPPYPPHGGGTMRIYQLIRGLAARHQVTCLTFAPDQAAEQALAPLHDMCRVLLVRGPAPRNTLRRAWTTLTSPQPDMALRNTSPRYTEALQTLLASEQFNVIQAESIEMAGYLQRSQFNPKLVLDQFNAEYVLQKRAALNSLRGIFKQSGTYNLKSATRNLAGGVYSLAQWFKLARYERMVMRRCDAIVAVSDGDRKILQALVPHTRIEVVPNGVDTTDFSREALAHQGAAQLAFAEPTLVFTGTLDFRPNIDAAAWFARDVLPLIRARCPGVRLLIVGKRPTAAIRALAADGATVIVGEVPDARPYIAGASVYVVPMRIGGGVRLKLLEALALQAPIVSTSMGAEGVAGLHDGVHCLLADDPQRFAEATLRLIAEPELGRQLGVAGRALVREAYDWSVVVPRLEALYSDMAQSA